MTLFLADNFSETEIKYVELIEVPEFLIDVLNKYFNQFSIIKILKLDRPEINSENYKIIIEVEGIENIFLLRKNKVLKKKEQIDFYLELINLLNKSGVEVSQIIQNKKLKLSTVVGENNYVLFNFIEAEYFKPTEKLLKSVAKNIAFLHLGFNSLPKDFVYKTDNLSTNGKTYFNTIKKYSVEDFEEIKDLINKKPAISEADSLLLENIDFIKKDIFLVKEKQKEINQIDRKIIHSDLHPHNILVRDEEVVAIVDFDGVRISQQSRDIACAIYRFGRQFFINNFTDVEKKAPCLRELFLEEYEKYKFLSKEEKELMPFLIMDEFLIKLLFVLRDIYKNNNQIWAKDLPKFLAALQEIKFFWPIKIYE